MPMMQFFITFISGYQLTHKEEKNWLAKMHHDDWNPSKYSLICSDHFLEKDIDRNVHLMANAIPVRSSEKGM